MSAKIIASLRHCSQLHGNTFLVATELAHRMNSSGFGRVAYCFLAWKAHCSTRTAIRQIAQLLELRLIRKVVIRTKAGYAWNLYQYIGPRAPTAVSPATMRCDSVSVTLPAPEREKEMSVRQTIDNQQKILRMLTAGSGLWQRTWEEIARLEALNPERSPV